MARKKLKVALPPGTPVCVGVRGACELFNVGKAQIYAWVKAGVLKYSVLSSGERVKKRFFTEDIALILKEAQIQ